MTIVKVKGDRRGKKNICQRSSDCLSCSIVSPLPYSGRNVHACNVHVNEKDNIETWTFCARAWFSRENAIREVSTVVA